MIQVEIDGFKFAEIQSKLGRTKIDCVYFPPGEKTNNLSNELWGRYCAASKIFNEMREAEKAGEET